MQLVFYFSLIKNASHFLGRRVVYSLEDKIFVDTEVAVVCVIVDTLILVSVQRDEGKL
jgi:hypothetical protein